MDCFFSGMRIVLLKGSFFTVSFLSCMVLGALVTHKYDIDTRNVSPEDFAVSGEETGACRERVTKSVWLNLT